MGKTELIRMRRRARTEGWTRAARNIWREGGAGLPPGRGVDVREMEEGRKREEESGRDGITSGDTEYGTVMWEEELGNKGKTSTPQGK